MRIGLAFDLKSAWMSQGLSEEEAAEFDAEETVQAIETALQTLGFEVDRLGNARQLMPLLLEGERWDVVVSLCEGLYGLGRESLVPCLLDAWQIPYAFSDPLALAATLHKGVAKRLVREAGVPTPDFAVCADALDVHEALLPWPCFVKPVAEGTGKGVAAASRVRSRDELMAACQHVWRQFRQPALVETYLPGREFTVAVLGTGREAEVLGVLEILLAPEADAAGYTHRNKADYTRLVRYALATDPVALQAGQVALAAWKALGLRDVGRVDLRCDAAGAPQFLEANPLPGLHPVDSDLPILCRLAGIDYQELWRRIMTAVCARLGLAMPCPICL